MALPALEIKPPKSRRLRRILLRGVVVVVTLYAVVTAAVYWAMRQTPDRFGRFMTYVPLPVMIAVPFVPLWKNARGGNIQAGDSAPDFNLPMLDHSSQVHLSSFRGSRPVVLVFGSYT